MKIRETPDTPAARGVRQESLALIREGGDCKVFVASFIDGVKPEWSPRGRLVATGLTDEEERWKSVEAALAKASQEKARIVIFPELTLSNILHEGLYRWLRDKHPDHPFLLVLAGSFHVKKSDGVYNEAQLLDRYGGLVLLHRKLTRYVDVESNRTEGIKRENRLDVLDTPLGSFVIPICKDFCDLGPHLERVWEYVNADWFLVPAFGDTSSIHAHEHRARELRIRSNSFCAVANQHPKGKPEPEVHGFILGGATRDNNVVCPGDKDSKIVHACCPPNENSNIAYACETMPLEQFRSGPPGT